MTTDADTARTPILGLINYTNPLDGVTLQRGEIIDVPADSVEYLVTEGWGKIPTDDETAAAEAARADQAAAAILPPADVNEPPRSGRGSGATVWQAFVVEQGLPDPDTNDRDAIIAAWDARNDPAVTEGD